MSRCGLRTHVSSIEGEGAVLTQTTPQGPSSAPGKLLTTLWDLGRELLCYPDPAFPLSPYAEALEVTQLLAVLLVIIIRIKIGSMHRALGTCRVLF